MFVRSGDGDFNVLNSLVAFLVEIVYIRLFTGLCKGLLKFSLFKWPITLEIDEIVSEIYFIC